MESDVDPSAPAADASTAPSGDGSDAASTMPDRRTAILRTGMLVLVLVVVFGLTDRAYILFAQHVNWRSRSIKFHNPPKDQNCSINLKQ